jgi:hypothetical protein
MQGSAGAPSPFIGYAIMAVVLIVVLGLRMRNIGRERPLKVGQLWIIPAVITILAVATFAATPPTRPLEWAGSLVALVVGAALGWQRGRLTHISVDPETEQVRMKQSITAFLFIVVLIALKTTMRSLVGPGGNTLFHLSPQGLSDILIALMLGLLAVQRIEMYLRAKRLLAEARTR